MHTFKHMSIFLSFQTQTLAFSLLFLQGFIPCVSLFKNVIPISNLLFLEISKIAAIFLPYPLSLSLCCSSFSPPLSFKLSILTVSLLSNGSTRTGRERYNASTGMWIYIYKELNGDGSINLIADRCFEREGVNAPLPPPLSLAAI